MGWREVAPLVLFALAGLGLAVWLSAQRGPATPEPPAAQAVPVAPSMPAARRLPAMGGARDIPNVATGANGMPCGPVFDVAASAAVTGMVDVTVFAPCLGGSMASVSHGPLRFDATLSDQGTGAWRIPALDAAAPVTLRVGEAVLETDLPDLRVVRSTSGISWDGPLGLTVSALEFGAARESAGHVTADRSGAGFVLRLGTVPDGAGAAVYVGPEAGSPGRVRLEVDAALDSDTCGREWAVVAFATGPEGFEERDIRLTLGDCDAPGGRLQLKNLLGDLTLARR